jgi:hypothetical protein
MTAFTSRTALQLNALIGVFCVAVAAAVMSLVLTQPEVAAAAVAQHQYGAIAAALAREAAAWLHALLRFL